MDTTKVSASDTMPERGRSRTGGRSGRVEQRANAAAPRKPFINRKLAPFEILNEEGLNLIEGNADRLLKEIGMEFHDDPEILDMFRNAGADVQGTRVRFEPGMCRKIIQASAPREFQQHARNRDPAPTHQLWIAVSVAAAAS